MTSSWISATQVVDHDFDCWGSITCMDAHHPWVYVGTSRGVVVAYFIESGEPSSDAQGLWQEQPNFCPIGESSRSDPGSRVMHTAQLSGNEETPVLWMKLHASGKLLFVRDGLRRLLVWNIESHVWVVQASVASFFVDLCDVHTTHLHRHQGWLQRQGPTFTVEVDACCLCTVENVRAARDAQRVEGIPSKVGQHCILRVVDFCCGQQRLRELQVMALRDAGHAETIAFSGLHVIIASAWSYRAISLLDGSVKVLMRLDSEPPLMAVGGRGEVFFRRGLAIYATEVHSSSDTIEVGAPLQVDEPPRMMMARFPFVCAFSNDGCCCYSLLAQEDDEGVVERLPLLDCIFGMAQPRSNILYAATTKSVTMIVIPQLRHQLRALVEGDRVEEAFHLLSVRRQGSSEDFSELERQLHLLCGFAHLSHQRPRDAMQHFGDWLDPRDLIKLLPHCISDLTVPPSSSLLQLVRRPRCGYTTHVGTVDVKATASRESTLASSRSSSSDAGFWHDSRSSAAGEMWGILSSSHLVETWGRCFQQLPVATSAQDGGAKENMEPCREVPHVGPLNLSSYLERCWVELKNEVLHYFRARLDVLTLPIAYARCMEYALLHLHLERGDHRSAYHLISHCRELCVSDVYDLLSSIDERRLLAILLFRHGYGEEAREVMDVHLSLSQRLGLSKHPRRSNEESEPHRSRDDDMEKDPAVLERHRLWSRQTHSDTSHWLHVKGNTPPTGITGHALWRLSPRLRARVARCLKMADDSVEAPSSQVLANMYNKATDEDLHDATMHVMTYKPLGGSRNEPTTFFTFLGASACELASEATPLPSLLSELSYLILDHMNLPAAAQLLEERPQEVFFRDEEGATVLHHLASVVARLPKHQSNESTSTAMHQLLLAVLQRLIHAGAPLHHITGHGLSVFDAGSVVTGEEGLHWWVSALLTCADLQSCSTLLAPSR